MWCEQAQSSARHESNNGMRRTADAAALMFIRTPGRAMPGVMLLSCTERRKT